MKLLIATPLYPPEPGGPATYVKLLEEELPKKGSTVTVVKFSSVRSYPKIIRHIAYFFHLLTAGRDADVMFALDPVSTGLPCALAARLLGKVFIVKIVGDYAWEQGTQRFGIRTTLDEFATTKQVPFAVQLLRDVQRWTALRAKKIIVPSAYLKGIVETWRIPAKRIEVIYNAVSIETEGKIPDVIAKLKQPVIVSAGRLVPWKGMKGLVDAVEKMQSRVKASIAIVGSGPEYDSISHVAHMKLGTNAAVTGPLTAETLHALIAHADVFALNTSYEGLSHVLIEALALGTPIVTTPVGGNKELIQDGVNGLLVPVDDVDAWSAALTRLLEDSSLRERISVAAKKSAEKFSVDALVTKTDALIASVV